MKNLIVGTALTGLGCAAGFVFGITAMAAIMIHPKLDNSCKNLFDCVYKTDPDRYNKIFVELMVEHAKEKEVKENEEN